MGTNSVSFSDLHDHFLVSLLEKFENDEELEEFTAGTGFSKLIEETSDDMAKSLADGILDNSYEQLNTEKVSRIGFEQRNYQRWREGFDYLTALINSCAEIGEAASQHFQENIEVVGGAKASAAITLHARCTRVAGEAFALMRCGYADGAFARWRTMHELYVTCIFIANSSEIVAQRYHDAWLLRRFKSAKEHQRYEQRANLREFEDSELQLLKIECERIETKYQDEL